jgi:aryl-alcohol dehydrogenase-like predicted oxidoreductase
MREGARITGSKSDRYLTDRNWKIVEELRAFAMSRGHTLLEAAFSWLAARSVVSSVIAGATQPAQVEQNAAAVSWRLNAEEVAELDRITA